MQLLLDRCVPGVEGLLIPPGLEDNEVAGTADLLEELNPDKAVELPVRVAVPVKCGGGVLDGVGSRLDVRDRVEGLVGWDVGLDLKSKTRRQHRAREKKPG